MSSCSVLGTHRWQLCFPSVCQSWTGDRVWDMSSVLVWRNYYLWCRQHSGHWAWCQRHRPVCPGCWPLTTRTFIQNNAKHKTCTAIYDTGHVVLMLILYLIARFLYKTECHASTGRTFDTEMYSDCDNYADTNTLKLITNETTDISHSSDHILLLILPHFQLNCNIYISALS